MDERNNRESSEIDPNHYYVFTWKTKYFSGNIPKDTLTHLRVDSSVRAIPVEAFRSCHALVKVQLPETLTIIGTGTFQGCINLKCVQFVSRNDSLEISSMHWSEISSCHQS
eukprot:scaffold1356_cov123-Cylindrotheca_fusiformis.AAC.34